MARQSIGLSWEALLFINCPLILLNLTANIFYACCLNFPSSNRRKLKQPLKTLLGFLVWCSIIYFFSLAVMYGVFMDETLFMVSWLISMCYVHNSMTCSVWLTFYYYIQIVPSQRALLIWVKRNIRSVIYTALTVEAIMFLFSGTVQIATVLLQTPVGINGTRAHIDELYYTSLTFSFIMKAHILWCLCLMTVSSVSTVHYLHRHIRSMAKDGNYFSDPRIQSQIRVAISGVSQGVLYFLFSTYYFLASFLNIYSPHIILSGWISFTVSSLYISGTTVNLGIGQTTFRRRAAGVWKALKALCGARTVTNDVKMQASQLTSGETANTVTVDAQMSM